MCADAVATRGDLAIRADRALVGMISALEDYEGILPASRRKPVAFMQVEFRMQLWRMALTAERGATMVASDMVKQSMSPDKFVGMIQCIWKGANKTRMCNMIKQRMVRCVYEYVSALQGMFYLENDVAQEDRCVDE